jgi:hypothetical protein
MSTFSNAVDNTLHGQTGSGAFVGSVAPTLSLPVANNVNLGYTTTLTSATPLVLTASSNYQQWFTGSVAQTVTLPVTSTLVLGQAYLIVNESTQTVTVQSSGSNTVTTVPGGDSQTVTCILTSGTTAASWGAQEAIASGVTSVTGTAHEIIVSPAATGAITLSTPQPIDTTSNVTFGSITGPTVGVTNGSSPIAGEVGEIITASVPSSITGLTTNTPHDITTISLTAGVWLVYGSACFALANTSVGTEFEAWVSLTSATLPAFPGRSQVYFQGATGSNSGGIGIVVPILNLNITSTTTVYLSCQSNFTTSTAGAGGQVTALRIR